MRCITIAKAIVSLGSEVTFFVADEESKKLLEGNLKSDLATAVVLGSDYADMESELDRLIIEISDRKVDILLVDSYKVTCRYFERLRKVCKVAYMDDLLENAYDLDLLINYSGFAGKMGYQEAYAAADTKLLLGLQYAPLREQFYNESSEYHTKDCDDKFNVLIATGGADTCDMLLPLADGIKETAKGCDMAFHVVIGDYVRDPEKIQSELEKLKGFVCHRSVKDMAGLMRKCDIAVIAAGTMLTECAAIGLPAVFYQVADNQKINVDFWRDKYGMNFAGSVITGDKKGVIDNVLSMLTDLYADRQKLLSMTENLRTITDGKGALRIAKALVTAL